jgi:peptide/nickel transport system ATP-binding protein
LFRVSNLSVQYTSPGNRHLLALDNVSLEMPINGYTLAVVGESGSGKTTLGMSIMNLIEPPGKIIGGSVEFMDKNVLTMKADDLRKYRWQEVSMVYQSAMNSLNPVKTVADHVAEVITEHKDVSKSEARESGLRLLTSVGIKPDRCNSYPHEFSGGMRQRVVIAMALALSPKLLIADEPTSALDVVVQRQILALLKKEVTENQLSLLFITHEIALLNGLVDQVAVMFAGEIVELGPVTKVLFDPLHPYTQMLLGSILSMDSDPDAVKTALGEGRETSEAIQDIGCKYAKRCKYVFDRCRAEKPLLLEVEKGRWVACHKYDN